MANPVIFESGRVGWGSNARGGQFLMTRTPSTSNYRNWLDTGSYSAVLTDGALLQMSYDFEGRNLNGHRLAHIPPPFEMDRELLLSAPFTDVYDLYADLSVDDVVLRTPIRFDFNSRTAGPSHPAAHFTFNSVDCRIACFAPMRVGQFAGFIFASFYPKLYAAHTYLQRISKLRFRNTTVTETERKSLHFNWSP